MQNRREKNLNYQKLKKGDNYEKRDSKNRNENRRNSRRLGVRDIRYYAVILLRELRDLDPAPEADGRDG